MERGKGARDLDRKERIPLLIKMGVFPLAKYMIFKNKYA
jgi:hypothetical protein